MTSATTNAPTVEAPKDAEKKSSKRKDRLLEVQKEAQQRWMEKRSYEIDAPLKQGSGLKTSAEKNKWLVTFPYPYMNGRLHLGHAFSLTKAEFSARFRTLEGRRVLWPFAFHCTGMPICAAAQKLEKEFAAGEESPREVETAEQIAEREAAEAEAKAEAAADKVAAGVFKTKKGKVAAKGGGLKQSQILRECGVPENMLPSFVDPKFWLEYFPPFGMSDLMLFGTANDWRRTFITTDSNPFYDAFIRWQFNILQKENYIKYGHRESVFDPISDQPCADHDRASGEGVGPQQYTLIKMQVQEVPRKWTDAISQFLPENVVGQTKFFLTAATLRSETMCGQTNVFALPEGEYGLYQMQNNEIFIIGARAANNLVYQEQCVNASNTAIMEKFVSETMNYASNPKSKELIDGINSDEELKDMGKKPLCYLKIMGQELFGTPVSAPLSPYKTVYCLPLFGISMTKGTGIVTSVPSDAPDDMAALRDWQTKPGLREKYGIKEEWTKFDVVNVINTPEYGDNCADFLLKEHKVESQKDKEKLAKCKEAAYKAGFFSGTMIAGPFKGMPVKDAKVKTAEMLLASGDAMKYWEPEKQVLARTGCECVVSFCEQWYIDYANEEWTKSVYDYVADESKFEGYSNATRNGLLRTIEWMKGWACSRTFGLGTKLPWDKSWIIESLSDSTIYMAYYSIAHLLQGGILNGCKPGAAPPGTDGYIPPGPLRISPDQLTDDVFDYIFDRRDSMPETDLTEAVLDELRNEFQYWYPVDIRCSGKDLIQNHLTMSLFNHAAIWKNKPQYWPKSMFANGHVLVDNTKMSKSLGNFMTLEKACEEYSADVVRITCADAGDTLEDANFSTELANQAILRLTTLEQWSLEAMERIGKQPERAKQQKGFLDKVFDNEMIEIINQSFNAYERCAYREALKYAFYDMENLRKNYCNLVDDDWHPECILNFLKVQALIMSPIAPHFSEQLWTKVLKNTAPLQKQKWPYPNVEFDKVLHRKFEVLEKDLRDFRLAKENAIKEKKKKQKDFDFTQHVTKAVIYVAREYKEWQKALLAYCQTVELNADKTGPVDPKGWVAGLRESDAFKNLSKEDGKKAMPFASFMMRDEMSIRGPSALDLQLPFDELAMLNDRVQLIKNQLKVPEVIFREITEGKFDGDGTDKINQAQPAKPSIAFI